MGTCESPAVAVQYDFTVNYDDFAYADTPEVSKYILVRILLVTHNQLSIVQSPVHQRSMEMRIR